MRIIKIKKGLNLPIKGKPTQIVTEEKHSSARALIGHDYIGLKPTFEVKTGDLVKKGQVLFRDKKYPEICYTSPACGRISAIHRGLKRAFESIVIEADGEEQQIFQKYSKEQIQELPAKQIKELLLQSGLWTAIRQRPFGTVANPNLAVPALFVNAMDTNPLAPDVSIIINENLLDFQIGLRILAHLSTETLYVCTDVVRDLLGQTNPKIEQVVFSGPHPAGNSGTHIHFLYPVDRHHSTWYIQAQDVIAIGKLFLTGEIYTQRIVSLAGPLVKQPRLIRVEQGADLHDIVNNELLEGLPRIISGSVLSGRSAESHLHFLGRYHRQISVLKEADQRHFLGWMNPGLNLFSLKNIVLSKFFPKKEFAFDTDLHGGKRAIVPIGSYEKIMPLEILPTYLLRSLCVHDIEEAEKLGCLELEEEDLALCSFVCPSKLDYGTILRENLILIEKEG